MGINWFQIIVGFLSGGAFGALLKHFFDVRKARIQPIGRSIELRSFYDSYENTLLTSQVILTESTHEYKFSKLYTGTIKIANTGNTDYSSFPFGITTNENIKFIHIKTHTADRHHIAEFKGACTGESNQLF